MCLAKKPIGVVFGPNMPQHIAMIVPLKPEKKPGDFLRGDKGHVGFFGERFKAFPEEPKVCKRDVFGVRMKPDIFFSSSLEVVLYHPSIAHLLYKILGANV